MGNAKSCECIDRNETNDDLELRKESNNNR